MFENRLNKYAELIVKKGVNVQQNQIVVIRATTETKDFVRILTKEAYLAQTLLGTPATTHWVLLAIK